MDYKEYYKNIGKTIISNKKIQNKIKELANQINKDYKNSDVVLISNLKGSFRFLSDLISNLKIPTILDFIAFTSYAGTKRKNEVRIIKDLKINVKNKKVLVVEDIVDTGYTVDFILKYLFDFKHPLEVKICTLLDKPSTRKIEVPVDYRGFIIPDLFVIGYGLDYKEYFRELNDIKEYKED